jgi:FkbM family methyltransferase
MVNQLVKTFVYRAIDLGTASRGVNRMIGGESVRFPARWCRWYAADYEPGTFAFLRAHCERDGSVMDLGAHIGLFTVVMARLVGANGRVFSFEPTPQTRAVLERTVRLNGCDTIVEARGEAVAGATGTATFYDTGDVLSNANSLVHTGRSREGLEVPTIRLDDFVAERKISVGCLKIDIEGAELELLRGARQTFLSCRPTAMLSLHPVAIQEAGGSLAEIWELLQEYRLSVSSLNDGETASPRESRSLDEGWFVRQEDMFDVALIPAG